MVRTLLLFALIHLKTYSTALNQSSPPKKMDCKELANQLPGKVFFPGDIHYTTSDGSYFAAFENELTPTCIAQPGTATEVATIVRSFESSRSHTFGLGHGEAQLAVRSGGHTPWAGAANIDNGVTMDLRNLTGVHVDQKTGIASIGAGEKWSNVYEQLGKQGLAVAGGRVSKVGVAGLITGGKEI